MISSPLRVPAPTAAAVPSRSASLSSAAAPRPRAASTIRCAAATAAAPAQRPAAAPTLYDVLGLRAGATVREIKAAYRRLARERHPDVAGAGDSAADFVRLHHAYATLSDPDSRARYDLSAAAVAVARRPCAAYYAPWAAPAAAATGGARPRRRTWETDQCW